ncbi:hypothetical protein V9T40_010691 [Parthenolecanium corni]|uniref:Enolase-phosphatase E1 n=1 Tax=Parthenolecanium corni TaxID=536013 RepID=A0AAN9T6L7_9HEMI
MAAESLTFSQNHVLLDIEGTTTSISFVKDVLFPYYRENLNHYVDSHWNELEFQSDLALLKDQCALDIANNEPGVVPIDESNKNSVIQNILWQMNSNRKTPALKNLEGHMYRSGVEANELKGHVYDDVKPALARWKEKGKKLFIYSSGSVEAQKLLFGYSDFGNMLDLFDGHFDTTVGLKVEPSSYENIARTIGCSPSDVLFLTDVVKEAEAASKAGCRVIISIRPGNALLTEEEKLKFDCIQSFSQLSPIS